MTNVAWATDVHFDFVDEDVVRAFCERVETSGAEALLLGGDIANAPDLAGWLGFLDAHLGVPVYFVLGNHDYYGASIAAAREGARAAQTSRVRWLVEAGVVPLSSDLALVGEGGWGDARHGRFLSSGVVLNDYIVIPDLRAAGSPPGVVPADPLAALSHKPALQQKLHALGDEAAERLRPALEEALQGFAEVVVLTHVPPFREACWHQGQISNDDWLPGFTCKAVGDLLLAAAVAHPDRRMLVLCGHTHGAGEARLRPNLRVLTGPAKYGNPDLRLLSLPLPDPAT